MILMFVDYFNPGILTRFKTCVTSFTIWNVHNPGIVHDSGIVYWCRSQSETCM